MTDPADGKHRGEIGPGERAEFRRRVDELDAKLDRVRGVAERADPVPPGAAAEDGERGAAMGQALRIGTELVVGVAVGLFIGWQLDRGLGTWPWLLLLFFMLGFAGGLLNVIRSARCMQTKTAVGERVADEEDD